MNNLAYFTFKTAFTLAGRNLFGTGTKLVRISHVFTRDLVDSVRSGNGSTYESDTNRTVTFQFRTGPV